jgi:hypothetical protein
VLSYLSCRGVRSCQQSRSLGTDISVEFLAWSIIDIHYKRSQY